MRRIEFLLSESHVLKLDVLAQEKGSRVAALRHVLDTYFDKEQEMQDVVKGINALLYPLGGKFTYVDGMLALQVQRKRYEQPIRPKSTK